MSDKKSNPYIKTTLSALIANEQKEQKISAARLAERQKKAEPEKDAITPPKKTQALYTLSSSHSIDGKNVGLLLKKLTEIGLSPYIIDADGTNSKGNNACRRICLPPRCRERFAQTAKP